MARVLTGIQATGIPHLGNILGAILPGIEMSKDPKNEAYFFIADMHSLTTIKDKEVLQHNTYATAAAWLAFGFNTSENVFYRQSDIPQVTELAWYLNCFTPYPMLANAHSFKDKSDKLSDINAGLFTYPVLMTADIILYDADIVPVGKDQKQHLEMARDIAQRFNHHYGELLVLPQVVVEERASVLQGLDGRKMSKSYGNTIPLFESSKRLRKSIMKIKTNSQEPGEPKDPEGNTVFDIYRAFATEAQCDALRTAYADGIAWGEAKQQLFELVDSALSEPRERYEELMANPESINAVLANGAEKARALSRPYLDELRRAVGVV